MTAEFDLLEAPKDRWGRYKINNPSTGKERGYTRVTTIAKTLDDTASLADWKVRMAITGIVQRPDLLAQASTAIDDRTRLNKIAGDAVEAAGAYSRANLGTALHNLTQQIDLGMKPQILPGLQQDIETYVASIAAWDMQMNKDWIEVLLINDELEYAGTADRIVRTRDGRLVIFDLKTGTDLSYSYGSIAVQLALYAQAEWIYDWRTGERTPLPDIDKTSGIICHLPAGEGKCDFFNVDLEAGWDAAQMSMRTRDWRKRKDLFTPYKFNTKVTVEQPEEPAPTEKPSGKIAASPKALETRQDWLKQRISALDRAAQAKLILAWPQGVPRLQDCNNTQLDALIKTIEAVEADASAPFFETDPTKPKPKRRKMSGFDTAEVDSAQ
jgi:hypothetical protein